MASPSTLPKTLLSKWLEEPPLVQVPAAVVTLVLAAAVVVFIRSLTPKEYPLINPPKGLFQSRAARVDEYYKNGMRWLSESRVKYGGKPFRMFTDNGDVLVLPSRFANIIRNETSLSFREAIDVSFHEGTSGFEPFAFPNHKAQIMQQVIKKHLTKQLNQVTEPMSLEAVFALEHNLGSSPEWEKFVLKDAILDIVARITSRVFLGDQICRNEHWLKITKSYTLIVFKAADNLRRVPKLVRPIYHWFDPDCKAARAQMAAARKIVNPVLQQRRALRAKAQAAGEPVPFFQDAIDWADSVSGGAAYDHVTYQLILSVASMHTTAGLLTTFMFMMAKHPESIDPLRQEIIQVLRDEGLKKSAIYNLKLLDSALKEAQRMNPNSILTMHRLALKDIELPEGVFIRKGNKTLVDGWNMMNPEVHENPEKFDIYRFKRMREQPGKEHRAQLVSTSEDQLTFGHGHFACPGRFFAAEEIKIAACHLLLKYDWKLAPGTRPGSIIRGTSIMPDPGWQVMVRRRQEEIDFDSLEF